jgi:hypothetical protein
MWMSMQSSSGHSSVKLVAIGERFRVLFNADFFNVLVKRSAAPPSGRECRRKSSRNRIES